MCSKHIRLYNTCIPKMSVLKFLAGTCSFCLIIGDKETSFKTLAPRMSLTMGSSFNHRAPLRVQVPVQRLGRRGKQLRLNFASELASGFCVRISFYCVYSLNNFDGEYFFGHYVIVPNVTIPNVTFPNVTIPNIRNNPERLS